MRKFVVLMVSGALLLSHNTSVFAQTMCAQPFIPVTTPLTDMGTSTYTYYHDRENWQTSQSEILPGGLYNNGSNTPPQSYVNLGLTKVSEITPLGSSGNPDPVSGKIVFVSAGMSNASQTFGPFVTMTNQNPAKNPKLTVINTALSGATADLWDQPGDTGWNNLLSRLTSNNVTREQVQVLWMKHAIAGPQQQADHVDRLHQYYKDIVRSAKTNLPNIKLIFLTSRTRSYAVNALGGNQTGLNSEPQAFESAFAARRMIAENIANPTGYLSGISNPPQLFWGPYIWMDGENPRSDGRQWFATDLQTDCTHPSGPGEQKSAGQLHAFFASSPLTTPWFLDPAKRGPDVTINSTVTQGAVPLTTQLSVNTPGSTVYWQFDDGTTQTGSSVTKVYRTTGTYTVSATAIATSGSYQQSTVQITAGNTGSSSPSPVASVSPNPSVTPTQIQSLLTSYLASLNSFYPDGKINLMDFAWVLSH